MHSESQNLNISSNHLRQKECNWLEGHYNAFQEGDFYVFQNSGEVEMVKSFQRIKKGKLSKYFNLKRRVKDNV